MQMVSLHQPSMHTLVAARRVFWRHKEEFQAMAPQERERYLNALGPVRANAMRGVFERQLKHPRA